MTRDIRFKGYLTFDDSLKMQQALKSGRRVPPAAIVTVVTLACVALFLSRMQVSRIPAIVLLAFLGTFMAVGFRLMAASARKTQQQVYESACIERYGILKAEGIHIKKGQTRKSIPWEHFDRAVEVDGLVALVKNREALGFARYMFNTDSEWSRARAFILEH